MRVLDLFCGTKSVSKVAEQLDWEVISLDIEKKFNPSICIDFMDWDYKNYPIQHFDILFASPDCSVYSIASGGTHFKQDRIPLTEKAKKSLKLLNKLKECINYFLDLNPNLIYFIENPRARMRWFMPIDTRHTISYCNYGFNRMKPTDIWSNVKGFKAKCCKNGDSCHISAPRGSKSSTQGICITERYKIPSLLIEELFECILKNL